MNDVMRTHQGGRRAMRRWFAVSLLVAAGTTVTVADAATVPDSQEAAAFMPMSPVRILDTRAAPNGPIGVAVAAMLGPGATLNLAVAGPGLAVPSDATAVMLNVTLDYDATMPSFLTIWPTGEARPTTSANNALPNLVASNSMLAKLGGGGGISIFNQQGYVNVVIDMVGYLVPMTDAMGGSGLLVGDGAPQQSTGSNSSYYLDATNHVLYGPKAGGVWPVGSDLDGAQGPPGVGGILGGINRFNTAAVNLPNATVTGTAIPFAQAGEVFGSFAAPTPPATATTTTVGSTGVYEVTYRLEASATGLGTIQVYVNNVAKGPGTNIATIASTQAIDTVLVAANQGDAIQLRFTGAIGTLTTSNTSSLVITQVASA